MKALTFSRFGGPEVLEYAEVPDPTPPVGGVVVRTRAIGLNFADVYRRRGNYHLAGAPPYIAGYEAAGQIESVGEGVRWSKGDRVGFGDSPFANAELVAVAEDRLIPLPEDISDEVAAAVLLQGLTAQYLVRDSHPVTNGQNVVVHAAGGGVGLLLVQLARMLGARVLGLTSSRAKAEAAEQAGARQVALYDSDWVKAARRFGGGAGVDVVYDSVGSTLQRSLDATRIGGRVVFFGMAGGEPPPIDARYLMDNSKSITGGDLWNVLISGDERRRRASELFSWIRAGNLTVTIAARIPLSEGARGHALLESRAAVGKIILLP